MHHHHKIWLLALLPLLLCPIAAGAEQNGPSGGAPPSAEDLACGACRAVSRVLHKDLAAIQQQHPADGRRRRLGDLVEGVCRGLPGHARMRHPDRPDRWGIVPLIRDDGQPADVGRLDPHPGVGNWLRMRCEELLDDREEDVVKLLLGKDAATTPNQLETSLCEKLAGLCTGEQLAMDFTPPLDPIVKSGAKKLDLKFVKGGEL